MGNVRSIERRLEERFPAKLPVSVWGVDIKGERFLQDALAHNVSLSGALLCGFDAELRSGDVIGVLYSGKKARYRVVWLRYSDGPGKTMAAVQRIENDACPWMDVIVEEVSRSEDSPSNTRFPSDWT